MPQRRIIYFLEPIAVPVGGVAAIYRHVEILAANGIEAYVALREKPKLDFYGTTAPALIGGVMPQQHDICVIPELYAGLVKVLMTTQAKRLMFCQNQYCLPFTANASVGISEFGVHGIVVSSVAIQDFFRDVYGLSGLPLIPYAIDTKRFSAPARKSRQIAFMPRKLPEDAHFIANAFRRRHPHYADLRWVAIDGVTQAQAAKLMSDSALFLSLSHKESFGLPPLEAMSCGCLVSGYHGDGGREYMTAKNGWWAETGDWKACVDGLAAALELFDRGGADYDKRRREMAATVELYNPNRLETELLAFWRRELEQPFP